MNEIQKFIEIRENFSKILEPAVIDSEKKGWDFFINSTPETQQAYEQAEDKMYSLYRDEKVYNELKVIDINSLPPHEAKQLKDLLRAFDEELNTGEAKKALRKKEADIGQKYNTYVPMIDGKEVNKVEITKILQTEENPELRRKAFEAKIRGGDLIAEDLIELVKMRNEYAKTKGYDTYFEYMIKEEYDVEPVFLNKLIDDVYAKAKNKIKVLQEKRHKELSEFFGVNKLKGYHYGLLLDTDSEKEVNRILINNNIENISKKLMPAWGMTLINCKQKVRLHSTCIRGKAKTHTDSVLELRQEKIPEYWQTL